MPACGMRRCRQNEAVFLLFLCSYAQALCSTGFLKWTPELSQSCLCSCLIIDLWVGTETGSSMLRLGDVTLVVIIIVIFVTLSSDTRQGTVYVPQYLPVR